MTNKEQINLEKVIDFVSRGMTPEYDENENNIILNQKCIRNGKINFALSRKTKIKNIKNNNKVLRNFDILINSTGVGTLGRVGQINNVSESITADTHITIVRPNIEKIDPLYLGYYLKSIENFIENLGEGSTGQIELSKKSLQLLKIYIFKNKEYQKKVSSLLKLIDNNIDLLEDTNQVLDNLNRLIFNSWFYNYEKKNLISSEVGDIPKDWSVVKLSELVKFIKKGISPKYTENETYPVINQKCVREGIINFDLCKFTIPKKNHSNFLLNKFDILINSMGVGTLGRTSLFIDYRKKIVVDGCISVVRAKDLILSTYLFYILYDMEEELVNLSVGSTGQTTLRVEDILKLNILVPSTDLLKKFFDIASQNFECKFNNQNKIENLNKIKNQILPLLMSGKITIK